MLVGGYFSFCASHRSSSWLYGITESTLTFGVSAIQARGSTLQDLLSSLPKSLRYELVALRFKIFCGSYNVSPIQARGSTVLRSLKGGKGDGLLTNEMLWVEDGEGRG